MMIVRCADANLVVTGDHPLAEQIQRRVKYDMCVCVTSKSIENRLNKCNPRKSIKIIYAIVDTCLCFWGVAGEVLHFPYVSPEKISEKMEERI